MLLPLRSNYIITTIIIMSDLSIPNQGEIMFPKHPTVTYETALDVKRILHHAVSQLESLYYSISLNDSLDPILRGRLLDGVKRLKSKCYLLDAYMDVFMPHWIDWPRVPKKGLKIALHPLSFYMILDMEDKDAGLFRHYFSESEEAKQSLNELSQLADRIFSAFLSICSLVGVKDDKKNACIVASANNKCKSFYRWGGSAKTSTYTLPMKLGWKSPGDYPKDQDGWAALINSLYEDVQHYEEELPLLPYDHAAEYEYDKRRIEYYSTPFEKRRYPTSRQITTYVEAKLLQNPKEELDYFLWAVTNEFKLWRFGGLLTDSNYLIEGIVDSFKKSFEEIFERREAKRQKFN